MHTARLGSVIGNPADPGSGRRAKLLQLVRLIPFVERNYNLVELGPKETGKSDIFSESPTRNVDFWGKGNGAQAVRQ